MKIILSNNLARIIDGDGDSEATVDMGAYETLIPYDYEIYCPLNFR